jgi:hypothetical protein
MKNLDLDVSTPEEVPDILRRAAERFHESHSELQAAWQDKNAGKVWASIANILDRAAAQCERVIAAK